eukprot:g24496.t1
MDLSKLAPKVAGENSMLGLRARYKLGDEKPSLGAVGSFRPKKVQEVLASGGVQYTQEGDTSGTLRLTAEDLKGVDARYELSGGGSAGLRQAAEVRMPRVDFGGGSQLRFTGKSLAPGDCAFVGIYGEKDDFAILLTEDADGEKLSLTDGRFQDKDYVSSQRAHAKSHVKDAVQGTILRKSDFQTEDSWSFAAPLALTVFKGTSSSPTALCSVNLDGKAMTRRLDDEMGTLNLGETETAQYAGPMVGTKEDLLDDISNPMNWLREARAVRQLSGFSIASTHNSTTMTTTSDGNVTQSMTETTTTSTIGGGDSGAVQLTGCGLILALAPWLW